MRFVVDQNLSPRLAQALAEQGHDAVHTSDLGLEVATDQVVLAAARSDERVVLSADTDYGTILSATRAATPSVILLRRTHGRRVEQIVTLISDNLDLIESAVAEGSLIVLGDGVARVRSLPIL